MQPVPPSGSVGLPASKGSKPPEEPNPDELDVEPPFGVQPGGAPLLELLDALASGSLPFPRSLVSTSSEQPAADASPAAPTHAITPSLRRTALPLTAEDTGFLGSGEHASHHEVTDLRELTP